MAFHLKMIDYDGVYYDDQAESITLPAFDGEYQILTGHEPVVLAVIEGIVKMKKADGEEHVCACTSGFAEVSTREEGTYVEVLVNTFENPEDIDVRRAQEAKERAEEAMRQHQSQMEYHRSKTSLARAMARLKAADKYIH